MEERKLNFNAPLLSTRQFSTTNSASPKQNNGKMTANSKPNRWPTLPICKADLISDQVTEPASVPFTWEQIPGKPKVMDILKHSLEKGFEEQNTVRTPVDVCSSGENAIRLQSSKEESKEKGCSDSEDYEVYSDALDTLSPKGSFSFNRSISAVSGYDINEAKKPSGLSPDPQARDFMLNRFLPAAKAMTLDQPHYSSKKQPTSIASAEPRQTKETILMEKRLPFNIDRPIIIPHYQQHLTDEESTEDEDEVDKYDDSANISRRGCGLLPQLCFKNSLGVLSPVEGLKVRTHSFITSTHDREKSNKASQIKSRIQSVKKLALHAVHKQKLGSGAIENKLSCGSDQFATNTIEKLTASKPSFPYRRSGCMSPYHNAATSSPFRQAGFPGTLKEAENLRANRLNKHIKGISRSQEFLYPRATKQSSCSMSPVIEKTLYIDTENSAETKAGPTSDSKTPLAETLSDEADTTEIRSDLNLEQEFKSLETVKLDGVENLRVGSLKITKEDYTEKTDGGCELSPLAPPLPKTPSESWLLRNLSSVTSRNPFASSSLRSRFYPKKQDPEADSNGLTKWETIVKTSSLHSDHELIAHTAHQSMT